jgi:hypothetical protein
LKLLEISYGERKCNDKICFITNEFHSKLGIKEKRNILR